MALLDFLRRKPKAEPPSDRVSDLLRRFVDDTKNAPWHWDTKPADVAVCREILDADPAQQVALLPLIVAETLRLRNERNRLYAVQLAKTLLSQMLRRKLSFPEADLIRLIEQAGTKSSHYYFATIVPIAPLLGAIEDHVAANGLSKPLRSALEKLHGLVKPYASVAENRRSASRLEMILAVGGVIETPLAPGDLWADAAMSDVRAVEGEERQAWRDFFGFLRQSSAASKPSKKWLKEARALLEQIGLGRFGAAMHRWLPLFERPKGRDGTSGFFNDSNTDILRGLIFCSTFVADPSIASALGDAAERAFRKVPNVGPLSTKIGNTCVLALSELGTPAATGQLSRLRTRVKSRSASNVIERAFAGAAQRAGLTPEDLEELFVPTFGMTDAGVLRVPIGDVTAEVSMDDASIEWILANGKRQKSVPAALKKSTEVKELKKTAAELETMLRTQRERIDGLYLAPRSWSFADWRARYRDHPLVGVVARRLIWKFVDDDGAATATLWSDGAMRDHAGSTVPEPSTVSLWHPIDSSADEVLAWRRRLEALQLTQPFKQAHREIYVITDAELGTSIYSNRFAAHILRQHQFAALCRDRRWRYALQGGFDSQNTPTRDLPAWNLRAEFWVDGVGDQPEMTEAGIYLYLATDQVRFHDGHGVAVALVDVPPLVFSEVMRHVDLFVGVASIGNDPAWNDHGDARYAAYWTSYAFGELSGSAATRRAILQSLVPKLKIAGRCSFQDRFLVVRGDRRTYKIHLGSSNILMEPDDQYLCIVPGRGTVAPREEKIYVPFEGDGMLSVILSKALLLAEDRKITDPTIVRQIGGR